VHTVGSALLSAISEHPDRSDSRRASVAGGPLARSSAQRSEAGGTLEMLVLSGRQESAPLPECCAIPECGSVAETGSRSLRRPQ
jgi:hypothetical protein